MVVLVVFNLEWLEDNGRTVDSAFKKIAKQIVADLGSSFDSSIVYTKKASGSYNTATGAYTTSDTTYSIKAPVEFVISTEDDGRERREAKFILHLI